METIGISLGYNCNSAIKGVELGIRKTKNQGYKTCPFDECVSNYYGIIECIKDDFKYFLDSEYLKIFEVPEDIGGCKKGEKVLINTYYHFLFNHESPGHANLYMSQSWKNGINHYIENDFFFFKERYLSRINNFRYYLSSCNNITFIINKYNNNNSELFETLRSKHPDLIFDIYHLNIEQNIEYIYAQYKLMGIPDNFIKLELNNII